MNYIPLTRGDVYQFKIYMIKSCKVQFKRVSYNMEKSRLSTTILSINNIKVLLKIHLKA